MSELLTTAEVAAHLGVTLARVRRFVAEGRLHPHKHLGRTWGFTMEEVRRFAALPRPSGHQRGVSAAAPPIDQTPPAAPTPLRQAPASGLRAAPKSTSKPQSRRYVAPSSDDDEPSQAADDW